MINRAEELCVPVLLADLDTLTTIEIIEGYFGRSRFQQPQKIHRFNFVGRRARRLPRSYQALGLRSQ